MHIFSPYELIDALFALSEREVSGWSKCSNPIFPKLTIDGKKTTAFGQTWRRKIGSRWQYRQDDDTAEDSANRSL